MRKFLDLSKIELLCRARNATLGPHILTWLDRNIKQFYEWVRMKSLSGQSQYHLALSNLQQHQSDVDQGWSFVAFMLNFGDSKALESLAHVVIWCIRTSCCLTRYKHFVALHAKFGPLCPTIGVGHWKWHVHLFPSHQVAKTKNCGPWTKANS